MAMGSAMPLDCVTNATNVRVHGRNPSMSDTIMNHGTTRQIETKYSHGMRFDVQRNKYVDNYEYVLCMETHGG